MHPCKLISDYIYFPYETLPSRVTCSQCTLKEFTSACPSGQVNHYLTWVNETKLALITNYILSFISITTVLSKFQFVHPDK